MYLHKNVTHKILDELIDVSVAVVRPIEIHFYRWKTIIH